MKHITNPALLGIVLAAGCSFLRGQASAGESGPVAQTATAGETPTGGKANGPSVDRAPGASAANSTQSPTPRRDALKMIEGVRGGRHWVDAETAPPKSPPDSLDCLQIEPGLAIELVAAEPLVRDPVAIAFDQQGRMFVVEYGDYPLGPPAGGQPLSRVVYLEDRDHDGRADRRHVFADKLNFAHSLMPFQNGLLVGAQTQILYLQDTDGDHVADVRKVLFDGFKPAHPQMQIGNPRWGIDNWVYLNYGPGSITSAARSAEAVEMPRKDFRFHPHTMQFEADTGMGQFGNTIDRWGHRFYCTNRNPIMTSLVPPAVLQRNRYAVTAKAYYDVGRSGGETRVYPLVEMKSNHLSHAGTHTSACGVTAYCGDLLGPAYESSVFVCEPIGHLVTRSIVEPKGLRLTARRARPKADFLASTDTWFRPASLANGPDGALYLADMYRLWVEHPKFLPPEIAEQLDWRAGEDHGRVYRIVPQGESLSASPRAGSRSRKPFQPPTTRAETVELLADSNGWRQFLGQRLLVEQQDRAAAAQVRDLLLQHGQATTRLHALWTLDGLGALEQSDVVHGLCDPDPHVRRDALKLARRWLDQEAVLRRVLELAGDGDARVRFEVAIALGDRTSAAATRTLARLAASDGRDPWFAIGLISSAKDRSGAILGALLQNKKFMSEGSADQIALVKRLASVVGTRGDVEELAQLLQSLAAERAGHVWWRAAAISGLGAGLPRHRGQLGRLTLPKLLADPPQRLAAVVQQVAELLEANQQAALDRNRSIADRTAAVELLAYQPFARAAPAMETLLQNDQPVEVQLACIDALAANGSPEVAEIVLRRWPQLGPAVRGPALALLLRRVSSTKQTLQAMAAGQMRPAALSIDQRVRLLKHSDDSIRQQAIKLFGGAVSSNRRKVADRYQVSLKLDASAAAGAHVFGRVCAKCHRLDGQGHEAGPDLSDVRNRSKLALLYDILDPNAKVEPRFTAYSVVTIDGKIFNGLIVAETDEAVVLGMAEGKQETIGRGEIEEIRASNVSLMPEGMEKEIATQDMADLLEFLKSRT